MQMRVPLIKLVLCVLSFSVLFIGCSKDTAVENEALKPEPEEKQEEPTQSVVSEKYVQLDWSKNPLLEADYDKGTFKLSKSAETSKLGKGSVMTVLTDSSYCIAIVTDVKTSGNIVSIESVKGNLCDIFSNTSFTLSSAGKESRSGNETIAPSYAKIYRDGHWVTMPLVTNRGQTTLTSEVWNWSSNKLENQTLFEKNGFRAFFEECSFNAGVDINMTLNFGGRTLAHKIADGLKVWRSGLLKAESYAEGDFKARQKIKLVGKGKISYKEKEDEMVGNHNIFPPIRVLFFVSGVPIEIMVNADWYRGASIDTEGEFEASVGYAAHVNGKLGLSWEQETNSVQPIKSLTPEFELINPEAGGWFKTTAKTWFYPRVRFILYETIGASFDFKPYLQTDVEGGFREEMFSDESDYCAVTLDNYAGFDIDAGISTLLPGFTYEQSNHKLGSFNIAHKKIFTSPKHIETISKPQSYNKGQTYKVEFEVFDNNDLLNVSHPTILPQIVTFEGDGHISQKYGQAKNGIVSVEWIPENVTDTLRAVLYNGKGDIIDHADYTIDFTPYGTWDHVELVPDCNSGTQRVLWIERLVLREDSTYSVYTNLSKRCIEHDHYIEVHGRYQFTEVEDCIPNGYGQMICEFRPGIIFNPISMIAVKLKTGESLLDSYKNTWPCCGGTYEMDIRKSNDNYKDRNPPPGYSDLMLVDCIGCYTKKNDDNSDWGTKLNSAVYPYIWWNYVDPL